MGRRHFAQMQSNVRWQLHPFVIICYRYQFMNSVPTGAETRIIYNIFIKIHKHIEFHSSFHPIQRKRAPLLLDASLRVTFREHAPLFWVQRSLAIMRAVTQRSNQTNLNGNASYLVPLTPSATYH